MTRERDLTSGKSSRSREEEATMYERLLVALDGSEMAERILPLVEALAHEFGSELTLLRATMSLETIVASTTSPGDPGAGAVVDPTSIMEAERQDARAYLDALLERLRAGGLRAQGEIVEGAAADVLVERAIAIGADLIAMATHGRGGIERLVFGSVGDEVVRNAPCPILLLPIHEGEEAQNGDERA
jgi:nucleotide-binding universal stress UspA family protein